jgi:S-methylmethionine-dependent homocysteine/selenocysteine methylase
MSTLQEMLERREILILDGAIGTELESRGVPMHGVAWSAAAIETHPDVVRQVHEDYIRAGADIIIANTFATSRAVLERAGMGGRVRDLNVRAVALAKEARDVASGGRDVYIAGSISTSLMPDSEGRTSSGSALPAPRGTGKGSLP